MNYGSTKEHFVESQHSFSEEQRRFARIVSEDIRTTPCDSERKATFPMNISIIAVNILLLLVFSTLINANGHFFAGLMIVIILILLHVFLVPYFVPIVDVYCETIVKFIAQ